MLKKFIKRINANEINAASSYIYPADHANLYLFKEEVLPKSPNVMFRIQEKQDAVINGQKCVIAKIACENMSQFFIDYMTNIGLMQDNIITDTIYVKSTNKGNRITFDWTHLQGENLRLATVGVISNIRKGAGLKYPAIYKIDTIKPIVINEYVGDQKWVQCYTIDDMCNIVQGFVPKQNLKKQSSLFFSPNIFESMGLLIAFIILVIIAFPLVYARNIVTIFSNLPVFGIILAVALVLGLIWVFYQLIEKILFELFLINLPY
jgi:hypothetical protein